jgi:group I intron endonuclease
MVIYKTTNLINGKIYIGKSYKKGLLLEEYLGSGLLLQNAIKKYGKNNFKKEILDVCTNESELNEKEIFWIKELNSTNRTIGYNIGTGGKGGDNISKNPNRKKIIKKLSNVMSKLCQNPLHRIKNSNAIKKKWQDPEYRKKVLQSQPDRSGRNNVRWLGYCYVYNSKGIFEGKYESYVHASKALNCFSKNIRDNIVSNRQIVRGKYKGYKFVISKVENKPILFEL